MPLLLSLPYLKLEARVLNFGMTNLVYSDICCIRNARCYFSLQTSAVQPLYAEICPPLLVLQSGELSKMKCNLRNAIVMLVKKKEKEEEEGSW